MVHDPGRTGPEPRRGAATSPLVLGQFARPAMEMTHSGATRGALEVESFRLAGEPEPSKAPAKRNPDMGDVERELARNGTFGSGRLQPA